MSKTQPIINRRGRKVNLHSTLTIQMTHKLSRTTALLAIALLACAMLFFVIPSCTGDVVEVLLCITGLGAGVVDEQAVLGIVIT